MNLKLTTAKAAKLIGIDRITLQRWIRAGKVRAPKPTLRNGRGVRLWSRADMQRLRKAKASVYRQGGGRKPKPKR